MVDVARHVSRTAATARYVARDALIQAHLRPYRAAQWTASDWHNAHSRSTSSSTSRSTSLDRPEEQPRYSVLVGYLEAVGRAARILDLGCGSGLLRAKIAHIPFLSYTGIDGSAVAIQQARRRLGGDNRTCFRVGDVRSDHAAPADVVVCSEVLYYIEDPGRFLAQVEDQLARGGHLLTSMSRHPGDAVLWHLVDEAFRRIDATDVRTVNHPVAPRGWRVMLHVRR
ncbi:MAG TPA: class I SAM-dependent methyltransferase [Acidimicrobiales bacterium]